MRRTIIIALCVATVLGASAFAVHSATGRPSAAAGASHDHATAGAAGTPSEQLAEQLAQARLATAKYAVDLKAAKADGYQIITRMIPDMGWHFMNPSVKGFDVREPPILVYGRRGGAWQLVALEWVFPETPAAPPLEGATYGTFAAACHYLDGTFLPAAAQDNCPKRSPETGAGFNFWHGPLVTMHIWIWYPNTHGLYAGTNPLMRPFNRS